MKKILLITTIMLVAILSSRPLCAKPPKYIFSVDSQMRPITGCLEIDNHSLSAIIVSMDCQKSIFPNIFNCSQGRQVGVYQNIKECQEARDQLTATNGEHPFKTDGHE